MLRLRQVKIEVTNNTPEAITLAIKKKLKVNNIIQYQIHKQAIDARNKSQIYYSYELDVEVANEKKILRHLNNQDITLTPDESYCFKITGKEKIKR